MILDRPLEPEEKARLRYWKTVCGECFGWSGAHTERWVKKNVDDFDSTLDGWLYHQDPLDTIEPLFVPEHLREKFRLGELNGLHEFYNGLEDILWLGWGEYDDHGGFPTDFDWDEARLNIKQLTEDFIGQNS